jgi:hypothetical protein
VSDVRAELQRRIVDRAQADPAFRARLLETPHEALAEELGVEVPTGLEVVVVEERADRLAIVLPVDLRGLGPDAVWAMTGRPPHRA